MSGPRVLCDRNTGRIIEYTSDGPVRPPAPDQIAFDVDHEVDMYKEVWDGATGLRTLGAGEVSPADERLKDGMAELSQTLPKVVKAVILALFSEINTLRVRAGLPPRTRAQLRDLIRTKV